MHAHLDAVSHAIMQYVVGVPYSELCWLSKGTSVVGEEAVCSTDRGEVRQVVRSSKEAKVSMMCMANIWGEGCGVSILEFPHCTRAGDL